MKPLKYAEAEEVIKRILTEQPDTRRSPFSRLHVAVWKAQIELSQFEYSYKETCQFFAAYSQPDSGFMSPETIDRIRMKIQMANPILGNEPLR